MWETRHLHVITQEHAMTHATFHTLTCRHIAGIGALTLGVILTFPPAARAQQSTVTPVFTKDVAPILQDKCQACHRSGYMAPMSLTT